MKTYKYFSTFTGIGGFEIGIHKAIPNAVCVGYSEIDKYATQIYQRRYPNHKNYGDITKINEKELPDFDLLVGGFPCQSFSIAGKRGGFSDTRGTLFFDIARIIKHKKPRILLLENVKGLLSHANGQTFRTIITTLDELGYDAQWQLLNSKNFGVPQNRERVYIVGHLRGTPRPQVFPFTRENETTDRALFADESQYRREGKLREYKGTSPTINTGGGGGHLPLVIQKARGKNKGGTHEIAPTITGNSYQDNNHLVDIKHHTVAQRGRYDKTGKTVQTLEPRFDGLTNTLTSVEKDNMIAKTVRAGGRGSPHGSKQNWDTYETEYGIRRLTPKECERLQAYPDNWTSIGIDIGKHGAEYTAHIISDRQRYKVLGNGVTTNVVATIMERIVNGETKGR